MTSLTLYIFIEVPSAADKMESHGVNILDSIMAYNSSAKSQLRLPCCTYCHYENDDVTQTVFLKINCSK
jgi:hypothetical protein